MNFTERTVMGSEPELSSTITTRVTIFDQALQPIAMVRAAPTLDPANEVSSASLRRYSPTANGKDQQAGHSGQAGMAVIE